MYSIESDAMGAARLMAKERLTPEDFEAIAKDLGVQPSTARKIGFVAAQKAAQQQRVETRWNGLETSNVAAPGDWIVTNLTPDKAVMRDDNGHENAYVVKDENFRRLYSRDHGDTPFGDIYRAVGKVRAIYLAGGFEILAPWNEIQRSECGYLLSNGEEVYGNQKETFEATYQMPA